MNRREALRALLVGLTAAVGARFAPVQAMPTTPVWVGMDFGAGDSTSFVYAKAFVPNEVLHDGEVWAEWTCKVRDGRSWETAYSLQEAVAAASSGDEIYVSLPLSQLPIKTYI